MELARELGMTVQQLEQNLGPDELEHWIAYFSKREFSARRSWIQFISLHGLAHAVYGNKHKKPPSMKDLDLEF